MADTTFKEPVVLSFPAGSTTVSSAEEARDALLGAWPNSRGKWYHAARRACASAAEGRTAPHVARRVFIQAAQESRIGG